MEYQQGRTSYNLRLENDLILRANKFRNTRLPLIANLMDYQLHFSGRPRSERKLVNDLVKNKTLPSYKKLSSYYEQVSEKLDSINSEVTVRTPEERSIAAIIKRNTNLQYKRSIWIGTRNVDLFFPMIGGHIQNQRLRHRGLGIEVDGKIHDWELKMRKDNAKADLLHRLGIAVFSVENLDVRSTRLLRIIEQLPYMPRLDSRARKRVNSKVYIETLMCSATDDLLSDLFQIDFKKLHHSYSRAIKGGL